MTKTYQTIELTNNKWEVFCLQTGEIITHCDNKHQAIRVVAALNAGRFKVGE